ncbi:MAG: hypothetical protein ACM3QX_17400 [Syntrophomonadaceae bacterium]
MKRSLALIFPCLILLSGFAHAQTSLFGGVRLTGEHLSTNKFFGDEAALNLDPSLSLGLKFGSGLSLEATGGYLISDTYGGMQFGLYARKNIYDILFAAAGINFLNTSPTSGYSLANDLGGGKIRTMLGGGLGLNTTENSFLEFQYMRPLDQNFGHSSFLDWQRQPKSEYWKVYGIYKLTFGLNFSFTSKPVEEKPAPEKTTLEKKKTEDIAAKSVPGVNIFLGLGLEGDFMAGKNQPRYQSPYMVGPTLQLGLKIKNDFTFETRWGLLISDQGTGGQLGIYLKKNIFHDFLYAVGGINFYDNSENPQGNLFIKDSYRGGHTLLGGGIGIHSPDDAFFELQYLKTLDEKFGDASYWDGNMKHTRYWTVNGFVKISIGYNFSLISKSGKEKKADTGKPVIEKKETEESAVEIVPGRRHLFISLGTGFPELLNTQLGCQIMDNLSLAGIFNWSILQHREFKKFTAGLRLTGYFSGSALNNISLEYSKQLEHFFTGNAEGPVTLTAGNDNMFSDRRFHFFWAVGLMAWFDRHGNADAVLPVFKIGTNLNF